MPLFRPACLILLHGAGSGPQIFEDWQKWFPRIAVHAVDLHADLDVEQASMEDYVAVVAKAGQVSPAPVVLCGWSMGGLVALMSSRQVRPHRLILIEPSPPGETQGFDPATKLSTGTFDPEKVYGAFPPGRHARPESSLARAERKRGISVPSVPCPTLVIYGHEFAEERGRAIARFYGAEGRFFPDLDHWGLVLDPRVPRAIARYLDGASGGSRR